MTDKQASDPTAAARAHIELGTELQMEIAEHELRVKTELIGVLPDRLLIVKTPPQHMVENKLFQGSMLTVRYIHRGTVFGFKSQIIDIITKPAKLMFITYPRETEHFELRRQRRGECFLPATITVGDRAVDGIVMDISKSGCGFTIKTAENDPIAGMFEVNGDVTIALQLPGVEGVVIVPGGQRNVKKDSRKVSVGVQFTEMDPDARKRVYDFIEGLLIID